MDFPIKNAPWWMNHSHVVLKGLYLAGDDAAIADASRGQPGAAALMKIRTMVKSGVVAVMMRTGTDAEGKPLGEKHEVKLPGEVEKLLLPDLLYINEQIDALGRPMSAEEQADFFAAASGS